MLYLHSREINKKPSKEIVFGDAFKIDDQSVVFVMVGTDEVDNDIEAKEHVEHVI